MALWRIKHVGHFIETIDHLQQTYTSTVR